MTRYEITPEITLKETIAETREFAKAMNEFADKLEQIEKKYSSDIRVYADSGNWPPCRVHDDIPDFYRK